MHFNKLSMSFFVVIV